MEFKAWVKTNETMWDWLKKTGKMFSPQQKAGRALGRVAPTRTDDGDYGAKLAGQMQRDQQAAQAQLQPERVKFKAEDLLKIKAAVSDYTGLLKNFYSQVNQALGKTERGPEAVQFAKQVFNQKVRPQYETLKSWVKWIDEMISWLPKRESVEEENELITEVIKVNYKNFEQMAGSIRTLTQAMSGWLDALGQRTGPQFMNWAKRAFVQTVAAKQHHLDKQFMWITDKIKQLMDVHGREYKRLPQASAARQAPPGYPAGSQSAFS